MATQPKKDTMMRNDRIGYLVELIVKNTFTQITDLKELIHHSMAIWGVSYRTAREYCITAFARVKMGCKTKYEAPRRILKSERETYERRYLEESSDDTPPGYSRDRDGILNEL
jgi:hypothetical protein